MGPQVTITKRHNTHNKRVDAVRRGVKEFMEQNPGVEVWVHGPGARSANRDLKPHWRGEEGELLACATDGDCAACSIVNAVDIVAGRDHAKRPQGMLRDNSPHFTSVGRTVGFIKTLGTKCDLRKVGKGDKNAFDILIASSGLPRGP